MASPGVLCAIWVKRAKLGPMDPVERAVAVAGRGLLGNADQGGRRQVTLIDAARWREAEAELGAAVEPSSRRANLMLEGIDLLGRHDAVLRIGDVRIRLRGETRPCERMDQAWPGLRAALSPEWRGGAYGELLDDGEIAVGDLVVWVDEPA